MLHSPHAEYSNSVGLPITSNLEWNFAALERENIKRFIYIYILMKTRQRNKIKNNDKIKIRGGGHPSG